MQALTANRVADICQRSQQFQCQPYAYCFSSKLPHPGAYKKYNKLNHKLVQYPQIQCLVILLLDMCCKSVVVTLPHSIVQKLNGPR